MNPHPLKKTLKSVLIIFLVSGMLTAMAHVTTGTQSKGGARRHSGTVLLETNDSLRLSIDVYGFNSTSWTDNWHTGQPLGTGGRPPLVLNTEQYKFTTSTSETLMKDDLFVRFGDFGYIPLWQPTQLSVRTRYRLLPQLWGTVNLDYLEDRAVARSGEASKALQLNELSVKWAPRALPGTSFLLGRMILAGTYSEPFDVLPLENYQIDGFLASHALVASKSTLLRVRAAAGQQFLGRSLEYSADLLPPLKNALISRNVFLGFAEYSLFRRFTVELTGGYQKTPGFTSLDPEFRSDTTYIRAADGWYSGLGLKFYTRYLDQFAMVSHGVGDVIMGWGTTDYVYHEDSDPNSLKPFYFSKENSSQTNVAYWATAKARRLKIKAGVWAMLSNPASHSRADSIFYSNDDPPDDTVIFNYDAEEFRALKWMVEPEHRLTRQLELGLRYDGIHYMDPDAHTNTLEAQTDEAMRPLLHNSGSALIEPSKWDREAVDAHIFSPWVRFRVGNIFRVQATYAAGLYSKEVLRHNSIDDFHSNLIISSTLVYRFARLDNE